MPLFAIILLALIALTAAVPLAFTLSVLAADIRALRERDPAARKLLECICCYPGLRAIVLHRIAHFWHRKCKVPFLPRFLSEIGRLLNGIEIHPGAQIGKGFFIDHGMGVVIGETTIIGENVTLYQGVTLGGTGKETGKRHPTIEDEATIGVGATVLGNVIVGRGSKIGAGSVVVRHVCPYASVVGVPGRIVSHEGKRVMGAILDHGNLPDPVLERLLALETEIHESEKKLAEKRDFLREVTECKVKETVVLQNEISLEEIQKRLPELPPARNFRAALSAEGLTLIAEAKKASPSGGILRKHFDVEQIAGDYEKAGAGAISCLTDRCYFLGSFDYLEKIKQVTELPVLAKDFFIDEFRIHYARYRGADAVLLIARLLNTEELKTLLACANALGMAALVEVHDAEDLAKARAAGAEIIGINNRNLSSMKIDIETTFSLLTEAARDGALVVSESGIESPAAVARLREAGVDAVLIGSAFMAANNIPAKAAELMGDAHA